MGRKIKGKMVCQTEEGYLVLASTAQLNIGHSPTIFGRGNPFTIKNIKRYLVLNNLTNYELITEKWKNANTKLKWRVWKRNEFHYFSTSWGNFKAGHRPSENPDIKGEWKRFTKQDVESEISKILSQKGFNGWRVENDSLVRYKNFRSEFTFLHEDGYIYKNTLPELRKRKSFRLLNLNRVDISTHNMYILVKQNTPYLLKEGQVYEGKYENYVFLCFDHGEFTSILNNVIRRGTGCQKCRYESMLGENHPNWKPDREDDERLRRREFAEYYDWRRNVFQRDDFTCQLCENKGVTLVTHHLNSWNWAKDQRLDLDNGITLCEDCHLDFHKTYGFGDNTKEQFEEYRKNTLKGLLV